MRRDTELKLKILREYNSIKKRDTWIVLGRMIATSQIPREYLEGEIVQVNVPSSPINSSIIFIKERINHPINWESYQFVNGALQHVTTQEIPTSMEVVLLGNEIPDETTFPPDLLFQPFPDISLPTTVDIPDYELERILLEAGVPFIRFEELEYSVDKIKYLIIRPVIEEYYKWFPIIKSSIYRGTIGTFNIPFPDYATGVMRVLPYNLMTTGATSGLSPFYYALDLYQGSIYQGLPHAMSSHPYSHNQIISTLLPERMVRQGMINEFARIRWAQRERVLEGHYNGGGPIQVDWTAMDDRFDAIPLRRKDEVRKLATARVLRAFGMLRSQLPATENVGLDMQNFLNRAKELEDSVYEIWKSFTKTAIIRGR